MKHAHIHEPNLLSDDNLKHIYCEAIAASYNHICQIFSEEKNFNRDKTDKSFEEILNEVIKDKSRHITIIYRDITNEHYDLKHWEFGLCSKELYLNICVRPDLAEEIFNQYNLKIV